MEFLIEKQKGPYYDGYTITSKWNPYCTRGLDLDRVVYNPEDSLVDDLEEVWRIIVYSETGSVTAALSRGIKLISDFITNSTKNKWAVVKVKPVVEAVSIFEEISDNKAPLKASISVEIVGVLDTAEAASEFLMSISDCAVPSRDGWMYTVTKVD
jgi:hypothetical protein